MDSSHDGALSGADAERARRDAEMGHALREPARFHDPMRRRHPRRRGLADLLGVLAPRQVATIDHGRVRYEGMLYQIVPEHLQPIADLDELARSSADRGGRTRYGTFGRPTWYGALDPATAIAEMCHRILKEPADTTDDPRPFALYQLRVRGRFVDLHGRELGQPEIIGEDYACTQALAREARRSNLCGVLYPSARSSGTCLAVFSRKSLRSARFVDAIPVRRVSEDAVAIRPPWAGAWWTLHRDDLHRVAPRRIEYA